MQRTSAFLALTATALTLSACGGSDDEPQVKVDDLAAGMYTVSVGDPNAPTVGKYFADASGNRLLVLNDSNDRADHVYRRESGKSWLAIPEEGKDVSVTFLQSTTVTPKTVDIASLVGSYVTQVGTGAVASFTVQSNGDIIAGATACKLSGKLSAHTLPATLKLSLAITSCGALAASSHGVLALDADYAPASFRLVADDGSQILDLWAYKE